MTARDLRWRLAGAGLLALGALMSEVVAPSAIAGGAGSVVFLSGFALALTGVVLMVQGRRVPSSIRVERSPHRLLPGAVRDRHRTGAGTGRLRARPGDGRRA